MSFSFKKKLCTLSVICAMSISPVFAEDTKYSPEMLQGFVQESKMTDLSPEYISDVEELFNQQLDNAKFETAEKTANYLVDVTKKYYGKHDIKTAQAYATRARLYKKYIMPDKAMKDLKSAEALYKWIAKDNDLKFSVEGDFADLYARIDQPYDAIEHFNKLHPNRNSDLNIAAISYHMNAGYYAQAGDVENTRKYLQKALEKYNSMQNPNKYAILSAYSSLADVSVLKDAWNIIEKQTQIAESMPKSEQNARVEAKIKQLQYYDQMNLLTEKKKLLDETAAIVAKHHNPGWEVSMAWLYVSYYNTVDNPSMVKKYRDIIKKYEPKPTDWSKIPSNSLLLARKYENDINSSFDDLDKAQKEVDKALKLTEPVKKYAPVMHAKFLLKGAQVNIAKQNYKEAKAYIEEAEKILKKAPKTPKNRILSVYHSYFDYYRAQNDLKSALEYQNKIIDKMSELQGELNPDTMGHKLERARLYFDMDNNEAAEKEIEGVITDARKAYGQNHVKVYEIMSNASYICVNNDKKKSDEYFEQVKKAIESGNVIGVSPDLFYSVYIREVFDGFDNDNMQKAVKYGEKAVKYARSPGHKMEIYKLLSEAYAKIPGKKALSQKYRKLLDSVQA